MADQFDHVTLANDVTLANANANANVGSQWNASSQGSLAKFYVPNFYTLLCPYVLLPTKSLQDVSRTREIEEVWASLETTRYGELLLKYLPSNTIYAPQPGPSCSHQHLNPFLISCQTSPGSDKPAYHLQNLATLARATHDLSDPHGTAETELARSPGSGHHASRPGIQFKYVLQELLKLESSPLKILLANQGYIRIRCGRGIQRSSYQEDHCRIAVINFPRWSNATVIGSIVDRTSWVISGSRCLIFTTTVDIRSSGFLRAGFADDVTSTFRDFVFASHFYLRQWDKYEHGGNGELQFTRESRDTARQSVLEGVVEMNLTDGFSRGDRALPS
ncbi:hypothetical protein ARMGADRAFT_1069221 [Armillaria gallica]|uniref:Uncharacterized protein n=1 Tax=Armillaria gallica TaxID=47427 RepID=A0A2H3CV05_ARMGA|nr:hypothetical protein ARMGADRAFT_1069221 [Armillaria gallica]